MFILSTESVNNRTASLCFGDGGLSEHHGGTVTAAARDTTKSPRGLEPPPLPGQRDSSPHRPSEREEPPTPPGAARATSAVPLDLVSPRREHTWRTRCPPWGVWGGPQAVHPGVYGGPHAVHPGVYRGPHAVSALGCIGVPTLSQPWGVKGIALELSSDPFQEGGQRKPCPTSDTFILLTDLTRKRKRGPWGA